jgi:hypothetical protein
MKTELQFVNHASVLISGSGVGLLSDPWYGGDAFNRGWNLLVETDGEAVEAVLRLTTHIWLSHEHPDHFSVLFFKKYKARIQSQKIKILFQETSDKRVLNFLRKNDFEVQEIPFNTSYQINSSFSVMCFKDGFYDSGLLVEHSGEKILNLNDCEVSSVERSKEIFDFTGSVDILLTQFSYAAWKGGKNNKAWRINAAKEKIKTMEIQISVFKPQITIPFASFIYFSHEENFYLNDSCNTPKDIVEHFQGSSAQILVMKPGDKLKEVIGHPKAALKALEFWMDKYENIENIPLHKYDTVSLQDLENSFNKYCDRISKNNNLSLMKILRIMSPMSIFQPVVIKLVDTDTTISFDYLSSRFFEVDDKPQLTMHSASLKFIFENSFGFDTLTVNGCFDEASVDGFSKATRTLAIDNLNTLGFNFGLKLLFNVGLIKIFVSRLYRVSRSLKGSFSN